MGRDYKISEVLDFLEDWKSSQQITKEFELSQSERYHLLRWLIRAGLVERCRANFLEKTEFSGKAFIYKAIKNTN